MLIWIMQSLLLTTVLPLVAMSGSDLESVSHMSYDVTAEVRRLKVLTANIGAGDAYFYASSEVQDAFQTVISYLTLPRTHPPLLSLDLHLRSQQQDYNSPSNHSINNSGNSTGQSISLQIPFSSFDTPSPLNSTPSVRYNVKINRKTTLDRLYIYHHPTDLVEYPETSKFGFIGHLFVVDLEDWRNPARNFAYSQGEPRGTTGKRTMTCSVLLDKDGNEVPCYVSHATCAYQFSLLKEKKNLSISRPRYQSLPILRYKNGSHST